MKKLFQLISILGLNLVLVTAFANVCYSQAADTGNVKYRVTYNGKSYISSANGVYSWPTAQDQIMTIEVQEGGNWKPTFHQPLMLPDKTRVVLSLISSTQNGNSAGPSPLTDHPVLGLVPYGCP